MLHYLMDLSARCPRPLVVMIDEADAMVGQTMVSFLTQLRRGYIDRSSTPFPRSIALVGMRQVRDYVLSRDERERVRWLGTTSPFNITAEAATLASFTPEQVAALLGQHTEATGQRFDPEAIALISELSQGHPWLVNAMADQIVERDVRDRSVAITAAHVEAAKETIILERRTHIDSLVARLREPRVLRILDPMLAGERVPDDVLDDDFSTRRTVEAGGGASTWWGAEAGSASSLASPAQRRERRPPARLDGRARWFLISNRGQHGRTGEGVIHLGRPLRLDRQAPRRGRRRHGGRDA